MMWKRYGVLSGLLAVSLAAFTLPVNAQQYKAKFTLPYEAHWGAAVLPAGEYTLWTDTVLATPFIHLRGNDGHSYTILSGPINQVEATNEGGHLSIVDVNGTEVVTQFQASLIGKSFSFAVPNSIKREGYGVAALKHAVIPVSSSR